MSASMIAAIAMVLASRIFVLLGGRRRTSIVVRADWRPVNNAQAEDRVRRVTPVKERSLQ